MISAFRRAAFGLATASTLFFAATAIAKGPDSLADLSAQVSDAVVNISATQTVENKRSNGKGGDNQGMPPGMGPGAPFDDLFEEFFKRRQGQGMPEMPRQRKSSSLGSGFVIDASGIVITNNHVIADATEVTVILNDGQKLKAEVLGKDQKVDVAVLKVKPEKPLKAVKFGDSEKARVGDWVLAVGNPFGLGGSVTAGIVSARNRNIDSGPYDNYIQTDASINKGNSGGPLFNMDGEVVGVNTAIISPTGGSIGIGFAVPADTVAPVVQQLRQYNEVRRGWLGVKIQSVSGEIAAALGIPENAGALVAAITPDGPAAKGGVQTGDVIMKFDNEDLTSMRSLPRLVARTPIDKTVQVDILRKGEKKTLQVTVGRLSDEEEKVLDGNDAPAVLGKQVLGLTLSALTDALRSKYGIDARMKGALVDAVDPKSPAASSIKPGDVIVQAANEPVLSPQDVAKRIESVKKSNRKSMMLEIEDAKGGHRFVSIPLE
jgi:serine protease Do